MPETPELKGIETEGSLGLAGSQPSKGRPCLRRIRQRMTDHDGQHLPLASVHVQIHAFNYIFSHTCECKYHTHTHTHCFIGKNHSLEFYSCCPPDPVVSGPTTEHQANSDG